MTGLRLLVPFLAALLLATAAQAEKRVALVIGNSTYAEGGSLANPKNDAELMAATLQSVGFEVTKLIDADQATMKRAMLDFGRKLRDGADASLFYYAGHGIQVNGDNYLVPVDAAIEDEGEVDIQAVNVNDFLQVMEGADSKVNIVVLDACRNNPFARSFRSGSRGLAMVDAPRGTYIAFATAPGQVAADGFEGNSPYTRALADAMVVPGLKIEDAFKRARKRVIEATDDAQVPWETTSITGDFYFLPAGDLASADPDPLPEPEPQTEPEPQPEPDPVADEPPSAAGYDSYWTHNGSVVGLVASGESRIFRYVQPRPGMVEAGAKAGDVVFEGTRNGDEVYGTAYVFSKACGPASYKVAGFAEEGPRIVMEGAAPLLDKNCVEADGKFDELVFEYLGKELPESAEAARPAEPKTAAEIALVDDPAALEAMLKRVPPNGPVARLIRKRLAALGRGDAASLTRYPLRAMGRLDVPQTYLFDLDAGAVTEAGADVWFEAVADDELYLVPRNGASLAPGDLSKRGPEQCEGESYSDAPIALLDLPPGAFLCVRTSDGRLSSFRIDALSGRSPRTLTIGYATWQ